MKRVLCLGLVLCLTLCGCTNAPSAAPSSSTPIESFISASDSSKAVDSSIVPSSENESKESDASESKEPNPLQPNIEKVVVQLEDTNARSALRIMEDTDATLYELANEIDGKILRALVRESQNFSIVSTDATISEYIALTESDEDIVFTDERYYQANDSSLDSLWVRIFYSNFSPKGTAAGGNPSTHKDIVVFVDPENTKDALFAWQSLEDQTKWEIYRLPDYGDWLKVELKFCYH